MHPPTVIAESVAARDPSTPLHFAVLEACAAWHVTHGTSPDTVTLLATVVYSHDAWHVAEVSRADVPGLGDGAVEVLARLTGAREAGTVAVPESALRGLLAELLAAKRDDATVSPATASAAWGGRVAALIAATQGLLAAAPPGMPDAWNTACRAVVEALRPFGGNLPP